MKAKQAPIRQQQRQNSDHINAINKAIKNLNDGRKEYVFIKNDEIRANMKALQTEIRQL